MTFKPFFINSNIVISPEDIKTALSFLYSCGCNVGNSYITYSLIKECCKSFQNLQHIQNVFDIRNINLDYYIDVINNQCSHVFLILQDNIKLGYNERLDWGYKSIEKIIKRINKPVIVCGIGANAFKEDRYDPNFYKKLDNRLTSLLSIISDNSISIGVRGYKTQEILHKLGINNVDVVGCPSYFENGKNRPPIKKQKLLHQKDILTGVSSGVPNFKDATLILQDILGIKYIDAVAFNNFDYDYTFEDLKILSSKKFKIFSDIYSWKKCAAKHKFYFGYKLHGSIIALNSGVPAVCTNSDLRATEMCEYLGIPHYSAYDSRAGLFELYECLDMEENNKKYSKLYENYEKFLNKNGVTLLNKICDNGNIQPKLKLYRMGYRTKVNKKLLGYYFEKTNRKNHKFINAVLTILKLKSIGAI